MIIINGFIKHFTVLYKRKSIKTCSSQAETPYQKYNTFKTDITDENPRPIHQ